MTLFGGQIPEMPACLGRRRGESHPNPEATKVKLLVPMMLCSYNALLFPKRAFCRLEYSKRYEKAKVVLLGYQREGCSMMLRFSKCSRLRLRLDQVPSDLA